MALQNCQVCVKQWHSHPVRCGVATTAVLLHTLLGLLCTFCNVCLSECSPWCSKSDDFCGFSLIFAEPSLEKEVGKSKIILFWSFICTSEQHNIFETVLILKLDSGGDCTSKEVFGN